jgi:hypothetical protein
MDDVLWRREEEVLIGGRRENWNRDDVVGSLSVLEGRVVEMVGAEKVCMLNYAMDKDPCYDSQK